MKGFTPFKSRANSFNYTPRYYDPAKEAREKRREELFGSRSSDSQEDYTPGQYIRSQRAARSERRKSSAKGGRLKVWGMLLVVILLGWLGTSIYGYLVSAFGLDGSTTQPKIESVESEEFNPYAPITIVPNDYEEE